MRELTLMRMECQRVSLFQLAARSLLPYVTAHRHLSAMERKGMVRVTRYGPPPRPLGIELLVEQPPLEGIFEDVEQW